MFCDSGRGAPARCPHFKRVRLLRNVHPLRRTLPLYDYNHEVRTPLLLRAIVLLISLFMSLTLSLLSVPFRSATIAKLLAEDSFALIFGINTLFALFFQTLLTIFVASGSVTTLVIREQFVVYASYFLVLGVLYGCSGLWKSCRRGGGASRTKNTSYDISE